MELHETALRRGIVVAPGPLFSARGRFGNFIRMSAGMPWSDRIAGGMRTLGKLVAKSANQKPMPPSTSNVRALK